MVQETLYLFQAAEKTFLGGAIDLGRGYLTPSQKADWLYIRFERGVRFYGLRDFAPNLGGWSQCIFVAILYVCFCPIGRTGTCERGVANTTLFIICNTLGLFLSIWAYVSQSKDTSYLRKRRRQDSMFRYNSVVSACNKLDLIFPWRFPHTKEPIIKINFS